VEKGKTIDNWLNATKLARPIDMGPNNAFANRVNSIISQLLYKPINCTIKLNELIAEKVIDEVEPQKICYGFLPRYWYVQNDFFFLTIHGEFQRIIPLFIILYNIFLIHKKLFQQFL